MLPVPTAPRGHRISRRRPLNSPMWIRRPRRGRRRPPVGRSVKPRRLDHAEAQHIFDLLLHQRLEGGVQTPDGKPQPDRRLL